MRIPSALVLAAVAAFVPAFAPAATYYVDRSHPQASDFNPGTEAAPWKTIQHAASTLVAGDTVYVKAGTYGERVVIANSGAQGEEIVLAAYPGHTVTIDGTGIVVPEYSGLVEVLGLSDIRFKGFNVTNAGPNPTSTGIQVEDSTRITIESNHTSQTASSGILVWTSANVLVDGNNVQLPMTLGMNSRNECISVGRSTLFEIRNNEVHDNLQGRGEGICLKDGSTFGSAHHNHVHNVPSVGIYIDAWTEHTHDIDVYANRVHNVRGSGISLASEMGGLLEHVRVFNNLSYSNDTLGFDLSANGTSITHPMSGVTITNNSFWNNGLTWGGGLGISHEQWTGLVIRNNAAAGNLSFEMDAESINLSPATIDHNLIGALHDYPGEFCGASCQMGDPIWVNPATADFHLQSTSPAIDNGLATSAPAGDFEGNVRPSGCAFDIGAYEFVPLPIAAPASINATATSATTVAVTWPAVADAVSYDVVRSTDGTNFAALGSAGSTSLSDTGASANTAYLYRVRAVGARCNPGAYGASDLATTILFTDDPLVAGTDTVQVVHIMELRTAVNAIHVLAGLGSATFTDPAVTPRLTTIKAVHLTDLRAQLDAARASLGLTPLAYTDGTVIAGSTLIKAAHVRELRDASR